MAKTRTYNHFCPAARALEVIGEKWSLLIVRDLLRGPRRFTDLLHGLRDITPKWLTLRLRALEAAGIVARSQEPGRREVWYALTPSGRDLGPVVAALNTWGVEHALRPPARGERVSIPATLNAIASYFNTRGRFPGGPTAWVVREPGGPDHALHFARGRWRLGPSGDPPDLVIGADSTAWAAFIAAPDADRGEAIESLQFAGAPASRQEFERLFAIEARPAKQHEGEIA